MNQKSGAVLVELVFVSGLWILLMVGFLTYARLSLYRQRALVAARMGALLQSSGLVSDAVVNQQLRGYFSKVDPTSQVEWTWVLGRFTDSPASRFYHLVVTEIHAEWNRHLLEFSERVVLQKEEL